MGLSTLQVCMDSSDWLPGSIQEESGLDSTSPISGDMLTCSRPMMERRLRPQQDQALTCPRCDSTHTKFCYYNNYSLSQPRYFCKTCRRYWTKGGTLRNIPVGGGCRKNKKVSSSKKSNDQSSINQNNPVLSSSSSRNPTDLHLSFPEMQFSHLSNILGAHGTFANPNFMDNKYNNINAMLDHNPARPIDFMENKLEAIVGSTSRNYDFMGNTNNGDDHMGSIIGGLGNSRHHDHHHHGHGMSLAPNNNVHNLYSSFGMSLDHGLGYGHGGTFIDSCQRNYMLPCDANDDDQGQNAIDVKPNAKLLSLDWQDQEAAGSGCSDVGYLGANLASSWSAMMNGYGSTATNPLV